LLVTAIAAIEAGINWSGCADQNTTVVAYMGLGSAQAVRKA
jgi:hypothetical protein